LRKKYGTQSIYEVRRFKLVLNTGRESVNIAGGSEYIPAMRSRRHSPGRGTNVCVLGVLRGEGGGEESVIRRTSQKRVEIKQGISFNSRGSPTGGKNQCYL